MAGANKVKPKVKPKAQPGEAGPGPRIGVSRAATWVGRAVWARSGTMVWGELGLPGPAGSGPRPRLGIG